MKETYFAAMIALEEEGPWDKYGSGFKTRRDPASLPFSQNPLACFISFCNGKQGI
jgi:hypothetical protein